MLSKITLVGLGDPDGAVTLNFDSSEAPAGKFRSTLGFFPSAFGGKLR